MKKARVIVLILLISVILTIPCYADADVYTIKDCQVVVTFISGHSGDLQSYADDFYDYNGFAANGIMLMVDTSAREYYILTSGSCISTFTDNDIYSIEYDIMPYLRSGDWQKAENTFVNSCKSKLYSGLRGLLYSLVGSLGLGALIGGAPLHRYKKEMNTVESKSSADDYIRPGSMAIVSRTDNRGRSSISKIPIPRVQSNGSGDPSGMSNGGSTIHMGSSGTSHGGHGGHF